MFIYITIYDKKNGNIMIITIGNYSYILNIYYDNDKKIIIII